MWFIFNFRVIAEPAYACNVKLLFSSTAMVILEHLTLQLPDAKEAVHLDAKPRESDNLTLK